MSPLMKKLVIAVTVAMACKMFLGRLASDLGGGGGGGGGMTFGNHVQGLLSSDELDALAGKVTRRIREEGNISVNYRTVEETKAAIMACLREDLTAWLRSGEPLVNAPFDENQVGDFYKRFSRPCAERFIASIPNY